MTRDQVLSDSVEYPPTLRDASSQLSEFSSLCHSINLEMLASLSDALGLEGPKRFETSHRASQPSDSAFNLIYAPTKPRRADHPDTTHTDSGTLTILFSDQWGIMLEHPETKKWAFVEPRPGFALANVADSLQALSGGRLHSCRHAINQAADGFEGRYFAVSYLRPEKAA